mmetsp:Transcript_1387/g.2422  ORF Transcript_1387/g.2422 Transcript_1387/m.2422 type:complete len:193 (+) Transcript_1387:196-774(+)
MCGLRVEDFDSMPDVADDLFLLAAKCLSHAPHLVLTPQNLPALVDCAMAGVLVQHKEACTSVLEFLEQICKACAKHPQVLPPVLQARGQMLLNLLVAGIASLPYARLDDVCDVLHPLMQPACSMGMGPTWVQASMAALPAAAVSDNERLGFYNSAVSGDRKLMQRAIDDLSDVCRRSGNVRKSIMAALLQYY